MKKKPSEMTAEEYDKWLDDIIASEPKNGMFTPPCTPERYEEIKREWAEIMAKRGGKHD